jgi:hypothetical protein
MTGCFITRMRPIAVFGAGRNSASRRRASIKAGGALNRADEVNASSPS